MLTSTILFISDGGLKSLISLKALIFIVAGMFIAAAVVGPITFWLHRKIARRMMQLNPGEQLFSPSSSSKLQKLGWLLFIFDIGLVGIFTFWVYQSLFWV